PEAVAHALEILLVTESALKTRGLQGSKEILRAIDKLQPMLAFFMSGDGQLQSFNGGGALQKHRLKKLFDPDTPSPKIFKYAPHSGYQRLDRNGSLLVIDVGNSPPRPFDLEAHLAPLAFTLSTNDGPLVVNCGWNNAQPKHWRHSMRTIAAHTSLILGGRDSGELLKTGLAARAIGPAICVEAGPVRCSRKEQETGTWLDASHDGYVRAFGLTHSRRIYMDVFGKDIRGEDSLFVPMGAVPKTRAEIDYDIRFHLHPDIKVTLAQDQKSALLIQPSGIGWRFRTDGGPLKLEKSVYLGSGNRPQRTEQIVISGKAYGDGDGQTRSNRIRWSFKRLGGIDTGKFG
ncbi:MAG: heparinase II/III family protein, partial [Robiginitomaculum sp.]|nr:heparinase II/III family protein [Robiginitomaculum sp.]